MSNKIKSGDIFKYDGKEYECVGTDDGKIWYALDEINESVWADPSECEKIVAEQSEGDMWQQAIAEIESAVTEKQLRPLSESKEIDARTIKNLTDNFTISLRSEKGEATDPLPVEPDTLKRIEADANFFANLEIGDIGKISHAAGINQWEQTRDDYKAGATAEATRAAQREKALVEALAWYADDGNYLGTDGNLATAWKNNIGKKAKEAINHG